MSCRAGTLLCATVVSCWLVSLTSAAYTWNTDTNEFDDQLEDRTMLSGVDESMFRSLIIGKLIDRIRNSMETLEEMDLDTEMRDPQMTVPWSYTPSDIVPREKKSCIGRFIPILHKCMRRG